MKIDLTQIPVVVSSCFDPKYMERAGKLTQTLEGLGFKTPAVLCGRKVTPYQRGATENIKRILSTIPPPFLLMEDDAALIEKNYCPVWEIPENADVVYFGGCLHANRDVNINAYPDMFYNLAYGHARGRVIYSYIDDQCRSVHIEPGLKLKADKNFVRVYNMYSSHAILFITEKGASTFLTSVTSRTNMPHDVAFSYVMPQLNVLMVKEPLFYQDDGHNNIFTEKVLYGVEQSIFDPYNE